MPSADSITVVIAVRNEAATLGALLDSLASQTIGAERQEVIVFDGLSSDNTRQVAEAFAQKADWRQYDVLTNKERTVPAALNAGLAQASCPFFVRLDGRISISDNYLAACLTHADAATAVGGLFETVGRGRVASSIAAATVSPFGVGRGFRNATRDGAMLDHHPFAVWSTETLRSLGGVRPELVRNQDDELSLRARRAGIAIRLTADARVRYRSRERMCGLAAQYFQYGLWKSRVGRSYGVFPIRSLAPVGVAAATLGLPFALRAQRGRKTALLGLTTYLAAGAIASRTHPEADAVTTALALLTVHEAYGLGVALGAAVPAATESFLGHGRVT